MPETGMVRVTLSPTEIYRGRSVFLIGGTGFLGKVTLSMLLYRFPGIKRVYVTVRAPTTGESENRFWNAVLPSPPFDPLRERYRGADSFEAFIREKVRVVGGDIGDPNLGYSEAQAQAIADDIDVVINGAGKVTFNPALEAALRTNVVGTENVIKFVKRMRRPALVHTSTCFVAGNRSGPISENDPVIGYFPRSAELPGVRFDVEKEIEDCAKLATRVREEARDAVTIARFTERARQRLIADGRDADDQDALVVAVARERKAWTRERLTELGVERATWWGWPNIYTYTKSLGEQLVAAETGIVRSIVRPSIVESAVSYPMPGWNEGFTTTAPLVLMILKGQAQIPAGDSLRLDVTPVDAVASVLLAVAAEACVREPQLVYQAATGDSNPLDIPRVVGLTGLYKRRHLQEKETGNSIVNRIMAAMEARTVTVERFENTSTPMVNAAAKKVSSLLDRVRPRFGGGRVTAAVDRAKGHVQRLVDLTDEAKRVFEIFRPFIVENSYIFSAANVRRLFDDIRPEDRAALRWNPEALDWYDYWLNVHVPGLERWVFPTLEEELRERPQRLYTYRDLIELFDTATKRFATRVAMRIERGGRVERYTYADLQEVASRAGGLLAASGVKSGDRVLLVSHNAPEWGMAYFGVLKAGATCVPVDPESSVDEIIRFVGASDAVGCITSDRVASRHPDLGARLRLGGFGSLRVWRFADLFAIPDVEIEKAGLALLPEQVQAHSVASLIFTSGTTGQPKGVMLSHRNLTSMVSMLGSVFDLGTGDGVLSVLPLHHTFEFSAGFLMPLSRGTQITYLTDVNREQLVRALETSHVTAMVGVPALWESLHRGITGKMRDSGKAVENISKLLMMANSWVRDRTPMNPGHFLFASVHRRFGGKIRYLISGGAALSNTVKKDLHGLGFTVLEGYGLTEASPVLTVTRPRNNLLLSSVGTPLPGVEVRIADADDKGIGEVLARGSNIMAGYYEDEDATSSTLVDGWLRTGDLGRLDDSGNLYLVGRSKEIIVDSDGRNVYPDDLEVVYSGCPFIKELCILGVPDGVAEKVACVVVPDYAHDDSLSPEEVRRRIEDHIRGRSVPLPHHKRVKLLHISEDELPRTATRKVKRNEVAAVLAALESASRSDAEPARGGALGGSGRMLDDRTSWLVPIVAAVSNRPRAGIRADTRLEALGFDSLMYVELAAAIEEAGGSLEAPDRLHEVRDLRELGQMVRRNAPLLPEPERLPATAGDSGNRREQGKNDEVELPWLVRATGAKALGVLQRVFYEGVLDASYEGGTNVPVHTNFIVAANHASHLDMGLVKMALGDQGKDLVALAAADYFFDNRYKRAYVENFTNLVPIERSGSLRQSLRHARSFLERGFNALIFPEGTRSVTGQLGEFKPVVGFLALSARVGILPMYLEGTYEALPKGSAMLRSRKVGVRIGRFISIEQLEGLTNGMPNSAAHRLIAALLRNEVANLRDGANLPFDAQSQRERWMSARPALEGESAHHALDEGAAIGD
ncbi:MAG: AMP-binding protein [Gemmatimonadaceae bacterium]